MNIKYLGHSCFQLEVNGCMLVVDPFITPNHLAAGIKLENVKADYILVSHAHQDHMADVLELAKIHDATLIANWEICSWFTDKGLHKTHPMNTGGKWTFEFGEIQLTNAVHSSSFPDGSYGGNPNGFIIHTEGKTVYYAGDTALTMDMQLIGMHHKPDLAFLPLGSNFTMNYEDALHAAEMIQCNEIIGMHFDTFPYIVINHEKTLSHFSKNGKNLRLMQIGEIVQF
jgi:L-ascorbate metabolism protein UlaG (beta-lactamase superfamily)